VNAAEVYTSEADLISDLAQYKKELWCHHCEKGLFFPVSCAEHADTLPVPDGADVAQMAYVAEADLLDGVISDSDNVPQLDSDEDMFQVDAYGIGGKSQSAFCTFPLFFLQSHHVTVQLCGRGAPSLRPR